MARRFKPLTFELVSTLPCECAHCSYWLTDGAQPARCGQPCDESRLKDWIHEVRTEWGDCGRVAFQDKEALGLIMYAPAEFVPRARKLPAGPPSEDAVLLMCMHIRPEVRHLGLGKVMLQAALRDLVLKGAKAVEAFATTGETADSPMLGMNFLLRQGFTVKRPHPASPLLRLELKSLAVLTEDIEQLLESLHIRLPARKGVPSTNI